MRFARGSRQRGAGARPLEGELEPRSQEHELEECIAQVGTGFGPGCAHTRKPECHTARGPENDRLRFLRPSSDSDAERGAMAIAKAPTVCTSQ